MECGVTVLTTGFWPTYKVDEVALPNELVKCVDKFTQFYESRTSHRCQFSSVERIPTSNPAATPVP